MDNKSAQDLTTKHFSKFGEFLVSFELSKHGWNVYNPVYDEPCVVIRSGKKKRCMKVRRVIKKLNNCLISDDIQIFDERKSPIADVYCCYRDASEGPYIVIKSKGTT